LRFFNVNHFKPRGCDPWAFALKGQQGTLLRASPIRQLAGRSFVPFPKNPPMISADCLTVTEAAIMYGFKADLKPISR
jgi:hypothetical protein